MKRSTTAALLAAALAGLSGSFVGAGHVVGEFGKALRSAPAVERGSRAERSTTGGPLPPGVGGFLSRAGWTNRRWQRHALKLRNRARNRRAHR